MTGRACPRCSTQRPSPGRRGQGAERPRHAPGDALPAEEAWRGPFRRSRLLGVLGGGDFQSLSSALCLASGWSKMGAPDPGRVDTASGSLGSDPTARNFQHSPKGPSCSSAWATQFAPHPARQPRHPATLLRHQAHLTGPHWAWQGPPHGVHTVPSLLAPAPFSSFSLSCPGTAFQHHLPSSLRLLHPGHHSLSMLFS